ncbi:hypothetical protein F5X98DRAFT_381600 [Xylaria grammica]|nr:hypothetical protein F5X98DRAFT_381600 [Xylaria grammica]
MAPTIATVPLRLRTQSALEVTPFERYGLPLIRRLGADARTACSFRTVLIVQPTKKSSEGQVASPSQLVLNAVSEEELMAENYGLTIDCQPCHDGMLIVQMNYDSTVLSVAEVEHEATHFSRVIVKLCVNPHSLLSDIDVFTEHGPAPQASFASLKGNDSAGVKSFPGNGDGTIISNSVRKDVMDLEPPSEGTINPKDDFLMRGGNSILAIKLSPYAREHGITLSTRSIMLNPDLKSMSAQMSIYSKQQIAVPPPPPQFRDLSSTRNSTYRLQISKTYDIAAGEIEDVYPCTPLQISLMALTLRERNTAAWALVIAFGDRWPSDTYGVICFGAVVSGRLEPVAAIEDIAGPTMSTVPVRIKIEMSEPVVSYIGRVRDHAIAATNAEHVGLSEISRLSDWAKAAC